MRSDRERLTDILEAIERIRRHTTAGRGAFEANELIQTWVVRHLEVIGEAASRISENTRSRINDVPWRKVVGMRNVLVHGYFEIDLDVVWSVVDHNLETIGEHIQAYLSEESARRESRPAFDRAELERRFHSDMVEGVNTLKREVGYNATRFLQMMGQHGGVGAAKILLQRRDESYGFATLWEKNRLHMSVEAFSLLPWYEPLFTEEERTVARRRLEDHNMDVDRFLTRATEDPPDWWPRG